MLTIKFKRQGKKHQASYRVIVSEKGKKLSGRFLDDLGFYNPHTKESSLKEEKIKYWMEKGAQPTDTLFNLLVKKGLISERKKRVVVSVSKTLKKKEVKKEDKKEEEKAVETVVEAVE
ncbi:MAG: 30S ribosomal protein S16 [Candidatus Liptonbacteria bacterium RIFOXYC1_FULL_36_8]|uniref:Small ribosomal subunit protein bS16 n=3 Tax=Candidatus Liptoniibacteriota TaxID=1817909 RepID=A0A1G2CQB0_9BACT|nr:MAG: 30S ribosomal protein S16 [Candidatus Liptonbacteria bacterium RIFOXYD1_FULL_36_11]OGZ03194.1 MAG: 30S ribosomal protein S16 [Candidatus Liptonbacteria bacterium RIFOXYC1_FULL_36_8]OGZ03437.1 MAG: 30S ribosomal protein S16 [Candidatus Liptonbacteria bacterium RIFOXYB1_FULL_36_10]